MTYLLKMLIASRHSPRQMGQGFPAPRYIEWLKVLLIEVIERLDMEPLRA